ncbi:mechanosensitive ion channel family protein [Patescibacteria group bacterium]
MEFLGNLFYNPVVQNWLLFFVVLIVSLIFAKIIYSFFKYIARKTAYKTKTPFDDVFIDVVEEPVVILIFLTAFWFALPLLDLTGDVNTIVYNVLKIAIVLTIAFFAVRLSDRIIGTIVKQKDFSFDTSRKRMLPAIQNIIRVVVFIIAALVIFDVLGLKVTSLLAGLGLGGLAVALAAKDTLSNLFGSMSVLADQPFKAGDLVKVDKHEGTVKEIGLRSTRIKTAANTEIVIPNTKMANSVIENLSRRRIRRQETMIVLKQKTPASKISKAIDIIETSLAGEEHIENKFSVNFQDISTVGPVIKIVYWLKRKDELSALQERLNFDIKHGFEKAGIELAETTDPMRKGINY